MEAEDEMVGWHHRLSGREFEQIPGDSERREPAVLQSIGSRRVGHDLVTEQQHSEAPESSLPAFIV